MLGDLVVSERYPRPPLQEAIFEFFPANAPGWSQLVFERLGAELQRDPDELWQMLFPDERPGRDRTRGDRAS